MGEESGDSESPGVEALEHPTAAGSEPDFTPEPEPRVHPDSAPGIAEDRSSTELPESEPDTEPTRHPAETIIRRVGWREMARGALLIGALFALVGLIAGIRPAATATLPHIVSPAENLSFQEVADGLPVPSLVDWDVTRIEHLLDIRDMSPAVTGLIALLLLGALWLCALPVLDPSFRLFRRVRVAAVDVGHPLTASLDERALQASMVRLLPVLLPLAALYGALNWAATHLASGWFSLRSATPAVLLAVFGILLFLTFTPGRSAASAGSPRSSGFPWRRAAAGAAWGIGAYLLYRVGMPIPSEALLEDYQMLGAFHRGYSAEITGRYLLSNMGVWFGAGVWLFLLARQGLRSSQRLALVGLTAAAGLFAFHQRAPFTPDYLAAHEDIRPDIRRSALPYTAQRPASAVPDRFGAARALAQLAELPVTLSANEPDRSLLLFLPTGVVSVVQHGFTEDRLSSDPASASKVKAFLAARNYRSALSWVAVKHLFNVGTVHLDTTTAMQAGILDLTHCPHLTQMNSVMRQMLFTCAATPENLRVVDAWADDRQFAYPTRESKRLIADLYLRFGATEKALAWYRRAEMPKSFLKVTAANQPLYHTGRITGILHLNGRPLAGVQVAAFPKRLNGLPLDLEGPVFRADAEIAGAMPASPLFPQWVPRPFGFRWISASTVTDAHGAFTIDSLTEGEYRLLCALPAGKPFPIGPLAPQMVRNAPGIITLNYDSPTKEAGVIDIQDGR